MRICQRWVLFFSSAAYGKTKANIVGHEKLNRNTTDEIRMWNDSISNGNLLYVYEKCIVWPFLCSFSGRITNNPVKYVLTEKRDKNMFYIIRQCSKSKHSSQKRTDLINIQISSHSIFVSTHTVVIWFEVQKRLLIFKIRLCRKKNSV
jgi:hypothetical protein